MIDFLKTAGISEEVINTMYEMNEDSVLYNLSCIQDDCLKIIEYLKELGIKNIDELLLYELNIFYLEYDEIVKKFSKFNIPVFVNLINNDYVVIENIYDVD